MGGGSVGGNGWEGEVRERGGSGGGNGWEGEVRERGGSGGDPEGEGREGGVVSRFIGGKGGAVELVMERWRSGDVGGENDRGLLGVRCD